MSVSGISTPEQAMRRLCGDRRTVGDCLGKFPRGSVVNTRGASSRAVGSDKSVRRFSRGVEGANDQFARYFKRLGY